MKLHLCALQLWVLLLLLPALADKARLTALSQLALGQEVQGTVRRTVSYGAFLDIGAESEGLVHFVDDASKGLRPGDTLKCRISGINHAEKLVYLSPRPPEEQKALPGGGGRRKSRRKSSQESDVGECAAADGTCTAGSALSDRTPKKVREEDTVDIPSEEAMIECAKEDDDVCKDCDPRCGLWANQGKCQGGHSYVRHLCPISCGFCKAYDPHPDDLPDCQDTHDKCEDMAALGGCHFNSSMMLRHCKASCRICGDSDPCRPNSSDIGLVPKPGDLKKLMEHIIKTEKVTVLHSDPYVLLLRDVIADEVVDGVKDLFKDKWEASRVGIEPGHSSGEDEGSVRTSEQQWCQLDCETLPPVAELTRRVEEILGASRRNFEDMQILRYKAGQFYKPHHDHIPTFVAQPPGPRILTFFLYLNDVEHGGTTDFPELNLSVPPRKGTALLWPSVLDSDPFSPDNLMFHEGTPPVGDSLKFGVNFWVHQYDYRTYASRSCLWFRRPRCSYFLP